MLVELIPRLWTNPVDQRWISGVDRWIACGDRLVVHSPSTDEAEIYTRRPLVRMVAELGRRELCTVSTPPTMTIVISLRSKKSNHREVENFGPRKLEGSVHVTRCYAIRCDEHNAGDESNAGGPR